MKSAAKLWSDEQKLHKRHLLVGKFASQNEAQNYSKLANVNVADRWSERLRSYPGRSDR